MLKVVLIEAAENWEVLTGGGLAVSCRVPFRGCRQDDKLDGEQSEYYFEFCRAFVPSSCVLPLKYFCSFTQYSAQFIFEIMACLLFPQVNSRLSSKRVPKEDLLPPDFSGTLFSIKWGSSYNFHRFGMCSTMSEP